MLKFGSIKKISIYIGIWLVVSIATARDALTQTVAPTMTPVPPRATPTSTPPPDIAPSTSLMPPQPAVVSTPPAAATPPAGSTPPSVEDPSTSVAPPAADNAAVAVVVATPTPAPIKLSAEVILNGLPQGQIDFWPDETEAQNLGLGSKGLLEMLKSDLKPQYYDQLVAKVGSSERVNASELKSFNIDVAFKPDTFQLEINVPAEMRQGQTLDFSYVPPASPDRSEILKPSTFSGYTNVSASKIFDTARFSATGQELPVRAQFENVQNLKGYFLESYVNYDEFQARESWSRGDIRLSKDFESTAVRATVGDLDLPYSGLQRSVPIRGLTVRREFNIDPLLSITPQSRFSFFLATPAQVEIFINERSYREIRLPAGRHSVRNLPLQPGVNNIRLQITDELGKVTQLFFPFVSEMELLDLGRHEFSYAVGQQRTFLGPGYHYDEHGGTLSLYHRYGLRTDTTLGLNVQGDRDQSLAGGEVTYANVLGTMTIDGARSDIRFLGVDQAYQLRYRSHPLYGTILRLSGVYLGPKFAALGILTPDNPYDVTASANLTVPVGSAFNLGIGHSHRFGREANPDATTSFANVSRYFKNRVNVSLQVNHDRDPVRGNETKGFVMLQWSDASAQTLAIATHETQSGDTRLDAMYAPQSSELSASAGVLHNRGVRQVDLGGYLTKNRGEFRAEQSASIPTDDNARTLHRTRLTVRTALAYTTSGIGFTRPITDSFALIKPKGRLKSQTIDVSPIEYRPQAVADRWGPGILPTLRSYNVQSVLLQTRDPLATSMLPNDNVLVRPTARSGISIPLEADSSIMLSGRITTSDPKVPTLNLLTGKLTPLDSSDPKMKTLYFFTNEEGIFFVESVPPGKYSLQLDSIKGEVQVNVPDSAFGPYEIGNVIFPIEAPAQ